MSKTFDDLFFYFLTNSEVLQEDLRQLKERKIRIRWVADYCKAFTPIFDDDIYISLSCGTSYKLCALAHEAAHKLIMPLPKRIPPGCSKEEFVAICLKCEAHAFAHEAEAMDELITLGVAFNDYSLLFTYHYGGVEALEQAVGDFVTSTTGQKYREYYEGYYNWLSVQKA